MKTRTLCFFVMGAAPWLLSCGQPASTPPVSNPPALKVQTVTADQIRQMRRQAFSDQHLERVKAIYRTFSDVEDAATLETWLDAFRGEPDPEQALLRWEAIVEAYKVFLGQKSLNTLGKQEAFRVLKMKSAKVPNQVIIQFEMTFLNKKEMTDLVYLYEDHFKALQAKQTP